jgi:hypothetical protein
MRVSSTQSQFTITSVWLEACVSNHDLMEAIARECYVGNNNNDRTNSVDDKRRRKLSAAIISFLSKHPISRRILAKQPNIISSMIRFIHGYDGLVGVRNSNDETQQQPIANTDSLSMSSTANTAFKKRVEKQMLSLATFL